MPSLCSGACQGWALQIVRANVHLTADLWSIWLHSNVFLIAYWWQLEKFWNGSTAIPWVGEDHSHLATRQFSSTHGMDADHIVMNIPMTIQSSLKEWLGSRQITCGYLFMDDGASMQAMVRDACLKNIISLVHKLHMVVKDAVLRGNTAYKEVGHCLSWD